MEHLAEFIRIVLSNTLTYVGAILTITQFFQSYLKRLIGKPTQKFLWIGGAFCLAVAFYEAWLDERIAFESKVTALQAEEKVSAALRAQNQEKDKRIQDFQRRANEQPKIVRGNKSVGEAELERLRAELVQREKRKAIRSEISKLMDEAMNLRQVFLVREDKKDLVPLATAWADRTYKYLRSIEPSYASIFNASLEPSLVYTEIPKVNSNAVVFLDARTRTLATILGELRD